VPKVSVLFVCLGNICRSPMAEAVFRHKVKEAGLDKSIDVDSAGTGSWHVGAPPHRGTRALLDSRKISHAGMVGRQIQRSDLADFDYILTMDEDNLRNVRSLGQASAHLGPFLDYAPEMGTKNVPDPYETGNFEETHTLVDAASNGLLAAIRKEHGI
jgi:protein-tyrosine phosphatase